MLFLLAKKPPIELTIVVGCVYLYFFKLAKILVKSEVKISTLTSFLDGKNLPTNNEFKKTSR